MNKSAVSSIRAKFGASLFSVKGRVTFLCVLPLLALIYMATSGALQKYSDATEATEVIEAVSFAPVAADLVHALQVERGSSAGFLGKSSAAFVDKLNDARPKTDNMITDMQAAIALMQSHGILSDSAGHLKAALRLLEQLQDMRSRVQRRAVTAPEMAAYYTETIFELIEVLETSAERAQTVTMMERAMAYVSIVRAIEAAGLERAQGAGGFGNGAFNQSNFTKFAGYSAMQTQNFQYFKHFALPRFQEQFTALKNSVEQKTVERYRQLAYAQPFGGSLNGVSGLEWYEASTARISKLTEIERGLAEELIHEAHVEADIATGDLWTILILNTAIVLLTAIMGVFIIRSIVGPIGSLTDTMTRLANGDLELDVVGVDNTDEIGDMARAVEVFKQNGIERRRLEGETEAERNARETRQTSIDTMISNFRETVGAVLEVVASNTTEMSATANTLTTIANDTSGQANDAANASQSASENVQAVAAAAEELAASIEEISRQVAKTNTIVNQANEATTATNEKVVNLARAAQKIGDVISLIQDIAEQTNLLALNTSIEAARAGEAGKGFAVVASEVKSLANQTATATEEISAQIADIQGSTTDAVSAIEQIAKTMAEVNSYTASIASAVEEQGAATAEISQSVAQAATGTEQVVGSMGVVTNSVSETNQSAGQVLAASEDVSKQAHTLKTTVDKFLSDVAAA